MVIRRVSKSGHSLVVALPKPMCQRFWLQSGDYLKLEDVVEGILIKPLEPRGVPRDPAPDAPKKGVRKR